MTATQAPTPGPLSGDDDLLPCPFCEGDVIVTDSQECQDAETYYWHRCAGCGVESEGAHGASAARDQWNMRPQPFRLAPTAPVEASGSEREDVARIIADYVAGGFDAALQDKQEWKDRSGLSYDCEPSDVNGPFKDDYLDAADAILALLSARPLTLGGQQGEDAAWSWLNRHVECDPADRDYSADEMVDAFMAGAGRYDIWLKALERIADEHQHRSGYCQTDITVEPALTAEEAQAVAREALSTTPARAEAQDEGAAGEFEAAEAMAEAWSDQVEVQRMVETTSAVFAKWSSPELLSRFRQQMMAVIQQAYIEGVGARVETISAAHPSPTPAADADRVRIAVEALEKIEKDFDEYASNGTEHDAGFEKGLAAAAYRAAKAIAALKSTAAKEGGAL